MGNKTQNKPQKTEEMTLCLDFKDYPELYQRLREAARADFRTPELEVLWLLHEHLSTGDRKGSEK